MFDDNETLEWVKKFISSFKYTGKPEDVDIGRVQWGADKGKWFISFRVDKTISELMPDSIPEHVLEYLEMSSISWRFHAGMTVLLRPTCVHEYTDEEESDSTFMYFTCTDSKFLAMLKMLDIPGNALQTNIKRMYARARQLMQDQHDITKQIMDLEGITKETKDKENKR